MSQILLVDDEPELLEVCKEALEEQGHDVRLAANGAEAISMLDSGPMDLVVTDLSMPKVNGMELLSRIRANAYDVDVIFLTGFGTVENAVECVKLGATDYLLKPFDIRKLLERIAVVLKERSMSSDKKRISNLVKVLRLTDALSSQPDIRSLAKEFLSQVRGTFLPSGIALYMYDRDRSNLRPKVLWGYPFKEYPPISRQFMEKAVQIMDSPKPLLYRGLTNGFKKSTEGLSNELSRASVMFAPLVSGSFRSGVIALVRDFRHMPFSKAELHLLSVFASHAASSFESLLVTRREQNLNVEIITSFVRAVEAKDLYTRGHSERVSAYAVRLGIKLGLSERECEHLSTAGMLHDIGKIGIPDQILNKTSGLTEEEFRTMRRHPVVGRNILARVGLFQNILPIIYHHHEHVDGSGYPDGLAGESIPLLARIISVVDGFEAMTSDRSYHKAIPAQEALRILQRGAGRQWDSEVVQTWSDVVTAGLPAPPQSVASQTGNRSHI